MNDTYLQTDQIGEDLELIRYKPSFLKFIFQYQVPKKGIDIGFGVYNLFDTLMYFFIRPIQV
jgi:hypothetical protein